MKKIFGLIALLLVMACDDGDMTFKTFNFGEAAVQSCATTGILFKVSGTEALILDLDPAAFINIPTAAGMPRIVTLNNSNRLIYRNYNGTVGSATLCSDLPPASPSVAEEWIALPGGTISIVTSERRNDAEVLTGYNHSITLNSITFTRGEETIIIENNVYGIYSEPLDYSFNFLDTNSNINMSFCTPNSSTIFRVVGNESLLLSLAPGSFPNVAGTQPAIDLANTTDANTVIFTKYASGASTGIFCDFPPPVINITGQWFATSGQVKIVTTGINSDTAFEHTVYLVNAVFTNTANETITVTNGTNPEYRLGKYTTTP